MPHKNKKQAKPSRVKKNSACFPFGCTSNKTLEDKNTNFSELSLRRLMGEPLSQTNPSGKLEGSKVQEFPIKSSAEQPVVTSQEPDAPQVTGMVNIERPREIQKELLIQKTLSPKGDQPSPQKTGTFIEVFATPANILQTPQEDSPSAGLGTLARSRSSIILNIQDERVDQLLRTANSAKQSALIENNVEEKKSPDVVDLPPTLDFHHKSSITLRSALVNLYLQLHPLVHGNKREPGPGIHVLFPPIVNNDVFYDPFKAWREKTTLEAFGYFLGTIGRSSAFSFVTQTLQKAKKTHPYNVTNNPDYVEKDWAILFRQAIAYQLGIEVLKQWEAWYKSSQWASIFNLNYRLYEEYLEAEKKPNFNWKECSKQMHYVMFKEFFPQLAALYEGIIQFRPVGRVWAAAPFSEIALFFEREQTVESTQQFIEQLEAKHLNVKYHICFLQAAINHLLDFLKLSGEINDEIISGVKIVDDFVKGLIQNEKGQIKDEVVNDIYALPQRTQRSDPKALREFPTTTTKNLLSELMHLQVKINYILKNARQAVEISQTTNDTEKLKHCFSQVKQTSLGKDGLFFRLFEANAENVEEKQDSPEAPCAVNSASLNLSP